ncbi:MFS transporter [Mesorhizobium sp. L103C131B0]|uniref:MFS transporter n=1 Tax=Mesorhizobium sp. L103C131B0 TaxID=1287089 RepID=UPI0003D03CC6|nr:MFS transporter [Mesorhizobium sp. L103C131B0]ESZ65949.1 hypothetical protein X729_02475 [Mesorhizobium sp. L103C131B0]
MALTAQEKKTVLASFLGWTLDAFDFFLLTFLLTDIATEFNTDVPAVSKALFLTLATRFIGAFFFGRLADKYGRKPILMLNIVSYSVVGALAAFSPNLVATRWRCLPAWSPSASSSSSASVRNGADR